MTTANTSRKLRVKARITQKTWAELVSVSGAYATKIERVKADAKLSTANRILEVLTGGKTRR